MSNIKSTKTATYTVYPFYEGCVFPIEIESVAILRNAAKGMVLGGVKAGHSVADQTIIYRQQLDAIVSNVPYCNKKGYIEPGSIRSEQAWLWCLNVMALEKMNALSSDDKNGTMIVKKSSS